MLNRGGGGREGGGGLFARSCNRHLREDVEANLEGAMGEDRGRPKEIILREVKLPDIEVPKFDAIQ